MAVTPGPVTPTARPARCIVPVTRITVRARVIQVIIKVSRITVRDRATLATIKVARIIVRGRVVQALVSPTEASSATVKTTSTDPGPRFRGDHAPS